MAETESYVIVPAAPGYRYLLTTLNDAKEDLAEYRAADDKALWLSVWADDVVAWRLNSDATEALPVTIEGVRGHDTPTLLGAVLHPRGSVHIIGSLNFGSVEEFLFWAASGNSVEEAE